MQNAKVTEIIPQHQTLEALKNHPNAANILEFLQDVLDVETQNKDFYNSLCYWMAETFPDKLSQVIADEPDLITDLCQLPKFVENLIENQSDLIEPFLNDHVFLEEIAAHEKVIAVVEENRGLDGITSEELLAELLKRHHSHDLDIKHWIADVQLNNPKALLPRK
jgi:hypothetical protein